jgi:AAA+ superfamily predicted ATPase
MQALRILVAQSEPCLLAQVVEQALRRMPGVTVVQNQVLGTTHAARLIEAGDARVDAVIAVTRDDGPDGPLGTVQSDVVISRIAIDRDMTLIAASQVGLDALVAALRALSEGCGPTRLPREDDREYPPDPQVKDCGVRDEVDAARVDLIALLRAWLDDTLLHYHRGQPQAEDDFPGLTRSAASIEPLLMSHDDSPGAPPERDRPDMPGTLRDLLDALIRANPGDEPLSAIYRRLAPTPLEFSALMLALAPELDMKYQTVYGFLQDDMSRRTASLALVCAVLGLSVGTRRELGRSGALARWCLFDAGESLPYADEPLRVDPCIANWILGDDAALLRAAQASAIIGTTPWHGAAWPTDALRECCDALRSTLAVRPVDASWIALAGGDMDGWKAAVEAVSSADGTPLMRISLEHLAHVDPEKMANVVLHIARAARLLDRLIVVDAADAFGTESELHALALLRATLEGSARPALIVTMRVERFASTLSISHGAILRRDAPGSATIGKSLAAAAACNGIPITDEDAARMARMYPLRFESIHSALKLAAADGLAQRTPDERLAAVASNLRRVSTAHLPRFARLIQPAVTLDDVVLPHERRAQLDEMVAHVRHAGRVLDDWGFEAGRPLSRGVAALFCGPSGTGKSMAAEAIAHALHTDAWLVDLAQVVSKYIGESEKNLDVVFTEAEQSGALLVFNEADVLFSKRSEVRDAHDRYANMEVAYLLQRMESFSGLAILTTNFRQNLDQAFLRRLRFIVEFSKPDCEAREAIWMRCLPAAAPISSDVDCHALARQLELTGGNISQITLRAAFLAAQEGAMQITVAHLLAATRAELLKIGMTGAERELDQLNAGSAAQARAA